MNAVRLGGAVTLLALFSGSWGCRFGASIAPRGH